ESVAAYLRRLGLDAHRAALFPWPALAVLLTALLLARWAAPRLGGGLSGDVYGALVEVGENAGLLVGVWLLGQGG
ncbi:adenosylcobinamide-GDP ribazoletransferase, partial [Calidithermus terrae]|uniref:adenosylcobinamide-GDP ribazoletransferase n=1 Tax=Calidithermus terrae TaxID=1408545 RepID=UPI00159BF570